MPEPSKKKILVVDDEYDICDLLKGHLENLGFDVSLAYEGAEAYRKVLALSPDCILLDIRIKQGEDALTFLRKLRSYRDDDLDRQSQIRRMPVIVLTGSGVQMRALFEQEGINDYLIKPFDIEILKSRIYKVVGQTF